MNNENIERVMIMADIYAKNVATIPNARQGLIDAINAYAAALTQEKDSLINMQDIALAEKDARIASLEEELASLKAGEPVAVIHNTTAVVDLLWINKYIRDYPHNTQLYLAAPKEK